MNVKKSGRRLFRGVGNILLNSPEEGHPQRYKVLRRNMIMIIAVVAILPLTLMALINYYEYQKVLKQEVVSPLLSMANKTKHSFELFLAERVSTISFVASANDFDDLADQKKLNRIFRVMKDEFGGFVDLGLIDSSGLQVNYVGPYNLKGKRYHDHDWFHEVMVKGSHVSDVFKGYRKFPHFVIAVKHESPTGKSWVLRTTIDTDKFNNLISSMGLGPFSDAFLINKQGVFQTASRFYGNILEKFPMPLPPISHEANVLETQDKTGNEILLVYTHFTSPSFILMVVKHRSEILKSWYTLKSELFIVFIISLIVILLVVFKLADVMVKQIEESDKRKELAYQKIEQTNKLASIGRLAAGVAHEVNNPMAIINEKAGLMEDLIQTMPQFSYRDKFFQMTQSITGSVDRCSKITRRLLSFARNMDVTIETLDLNEVITEVLGFLEKEALHRNIELRMDLMEGLPRIDSDRGQLQQVFLNLLNNAFSAVEDGGMVAITTQDHDTETVSVSVKDNGVGISKEIISHIFDPFFSTKKEYGLGLGLSISYGIVKKLGGNIEVESEEWESTVFTVFLPQKAKHAERR